MANEDVMIASCNQYEPFEYSCPACGAIHTYLSGLTKGFWTTKPPKAYWNTTCSSCKKDIVDDVEGKLKPKRMTGDPRLPKLNLDSTKPQRDLWVGVSMSTIKAVHEREQERRRYEEQKALELGKNWQAIVDAAYQYNKGEMEIKPYVDYAKKHDIWISDALKMPLEKVSEDG